MLSFSSACLIGFLIYTSASPFTPALFNVRLGDDRSKLILDLFWENVCKDLDEKIADEDADFVMQYARDKISNKYNEMSPALMIFDKHWPTMSQDNQTAIWKYLKVLCILCKKARDTGAKY